MEPDDDQTRRTLRLTGITVLLILLVVSIVLVAQPPAGTMVLPPSTTPVPVSVQPDAPPLPKEAFPYAAAAPPALGFFAADTLFILGYLAMFIGLYAATAGRARILPGFALAIGFLGGLMDALENAFFITYAALDAQHQPLAAPALPLLYVVGNLKYTGIYAASFAFGLALLPLWTGRNAGDTRLALAVFGIPIPLSLTQLEGIVALLLLLLPLVGALSIVYSQFMSVVVGFPIILVPLLAFYFWRRAGA